MREPHQPSESFGVVATERTRTGIGGGVGWGGARVPEDDASSSPPRRWNVSELTDISNNLGGRWNWQLILAYLSLARPMILASP